MKDDDDDIQYSYADLRAAVLAEREACAKIVDENLFLLVAAAAIRARDMSTKSQNVNTSAEHVHESDISIHDFKPDWDMIAPFHERIKELEIENEKLRQALAQPEQEPLAVLKVWDEKEQKHVLMNYHLTPPNKQEQEPELVGVIGNWGRVEWADGVYPQMGDRLYSAPPSKQEEK